MRLIKLQKTTSNSIRFAMLFPTGSINDLVDKHGLAHLLEHMLFKKADQLKQAEIYDKLECLGVRFEALTGKTFISFQFACRKDVFSDIVRLFSKMLNERHYSSTDLLEEKAVVLAEILQKEQTNMDIIFDNAWSNQSFAHSILGTTASIENITLADILERKADLLKTNYTIVLVGNFDDGDIQLVNDLFDNNTSLQNRHQSNLIYTAPEQCSELSFVSDGNKVLDVYYSYHTHMESSNDIFSIYVLDNALFRGDRAFITEYLREKLGYIYEIDSNFAVYNGEINWIFKFTIHSDHLINAIASLEKLINEFSLDKKYFQYVKAFSCDNLPLLYDDLDYLCNATLGSYAQLNRWLTPEEFAINMQKTTLQEHNSFFKRVTEKKKVYVFGKVSSKQRKALKVMLHIK